MTGNDRAWLALPDYVPEPDAAAADRLIGAHYFPGWKPGAHYGWGVLKDFPERRPLPGYYDESNPELTDWEIKWALEHGIGFFLYCWYREKRNVGSRVTPADLHLGHAIHEGLFRCRYRDRFRFAIMWENENAGNIASLDDLKDNLLPFWIGEYFSKPNYLRWRGRLMLFVYHFDSLVRSCGDADATRRALEIVREGVSRAGLGEVAILCEQRWPGPGRLRKMRDVGFDAVFAYCWHAPGRFPTVEEAFDLQLAHMVAWKDAGVLPFIPTATVGWDPMPWARPDGHQEWLHPDKMTRWYSTPAQYRNLLERIKALADSLPDGSLTREMLLLDNWNEWGEGHFICPSAGGGFGYLQAVREVFTDGRNLPDYRAPELIGRGPYGPESL
ncbi:MAG: glycoside hydrolase family 99-like domain-containing protein [Planctomycetota bacterium]|nr:glycoside hydrolase family 99-like domain-containing protein [Planctomycetota bacterium]